MTWCMTSCSLTSPSRIEKESEMPGEDSQHILIEKRGLEAAESPDSGIEQLNPES